MNRQQVLILALCLPGTVAAPAAAEQTVLIGACEALREEIGLDTFRPLPLPRCRIEEGCVQIDWHIAHEQQLEETLAMFRVTEDAPLRIHTANVNRLRYSVRWTTEVEGQSQAFETVSTLFESVFPVLSVATAVLDFQGTDALMQWVKPLEHANQCLGETTAAFTDVVLDQDGAHTNRRRLHQVAQTLTQAMPHLATLRNTALNSTNRRGLADYWRVARRHAELEQRVAEFLPRARTSVEGVGSVLDAQKRNSTVLLAGQAANHAGEPMGEVVSARYFVATSHPLVYHFGYSYGRLKDFDFTQVLASSGQDLFAATATTQAASAGGATTAADGEVVAFMSWEFLRAGPNDRYGTSLTIGTGLESPGQSLYYGVTGRVLSRLMFTGGWVTASATRGEGEVADATSELTNRSLFSAIQETTATGVFWSVSFRVY